MHAFSMAALPLEHLPPEAWQAPTLLTSWTALKMWFLPQALGWDEIVELALKCFIVTRSCFAFLVGTRWVIV